MTEDFPVVTEQVRIEDSSKEVIYLSGPMTGKVGYNYEAFNRYAFILKMHGYTVFNPADNYGSSTHLPLETYMRVDLAAISGCTVVALLPGWEESKGVAEELDYATKLGIPHLEVDDLLVGRPKLIGICGFARSGKDALASLLSDDMGRRFRHVSFASSLKSFARRMGWSGLKDKQGRRFLQELGIDLRREFGEDLLVESVRMEVHKSLQSGWGVTISDLRFCNEARFIRSMGGEIWRVERPGVGPPNQHVSETEHLRFTPDRVIINDGDLEHLRVKGSLALKGIEFNGH